MSDLPSLAGLEIQRHDLNGLLASAVGTAVDVGDPIAAWAEMKEWILCGYTVHYCADVKRGLTTGRTKPL